MRLFDTLALRKRDFVPIGRKLVRIYTCGPSVYALSHIGNFRTYLFEDVLVKYLEHKGYRVKRVMNITDVEDKAILAARKEKVSLARLQEDKIRAFFSDWNKLGMARPDVVARASRHVPGMVALIRKLCSRGYCLSDKSGVYFNVRKFRGYGKLRHLKNPRYFGKARGDDYAREGLWDFRLWKRWTRGDGAVKWHSPFGDGRPGWHIECSAMSMHYLGSTFDIHCGGSDNIYPHHENEIAQGVAATGAPPANFWLHARHLTIGKRKMSKRTGNVLYVEDLEKTGVPPRYQRFYLICERYRSPLDFTPESFRHRVCDFNRTRKILKSLSALSRKTGKARLSGGRGNSGHALAKRLLCGFEDAMDDDLNTRLAFRRIFRIVEEAKRLADSGKLNPRGAREITSAIRRIDSVLGVFGSEK
jgi:cysteinyl-tRNA synthetase